MIQRIQTLYLLVSLMLMGFLFVFPIADILQTNQLYSFNASGITGPDGKVQSSLPMAILVGIIVLMHLVIIFSYKKRIRQMRMTTYTIFLLIGLFGVFYFFTYYSFEGAKISFKIVAVFPLIAIILDYLAIRAIGKDEALIRSIDRIRK